MPSLPDILSFPPEKYWGRNALFCLFWHVIVNTHESKLCNVYSVANQKFQMSPHEDYKSQYLLKRPEYFDSRAKFNEDLRQADELFQVIKKNVILDPRDIVLVEQLMHRHKDLYVSYSLVKQLENEMNVLFELICLKAKQDGTTVPINPYAL